MRTAALLVLLIVSGLFLLPDPLPLPIALLAIPAIPLLLLKSWLSRWLGISLLALALSTAHFHWLFSWQLPEVDIQKDVVIEGRIISLPESGERSQRFLFALDAYNGQPVPAWQAVTLRLSWYEPDVLPRVGERWQFTARLKPPRGSVNFQGFDYERWLFAQHVRATGYIRAKPAAVRMQTADGVSIEGVRQSLRESVLALPLENGAVIAGLSFGADDAITPEEWRLLRDTGTTHLVAISGLHITLIAAVIGFLFAWLWRLSARLCLMIPAPQAGIVAGLLAALLYSALAGFSTPTLRAVLMLAVVAAGWLWRRQIALSSTLALALVLTLLLDPCAVLEPGFWLSFGAVALLFLLGSGRPIAPPWWVTAVRVQVLLSLALLPLTLLWFGQASLVSPLANLLAVPWVSFVSTPLALLGCLLLPWWSAAGQLLLSASDWTLARFFDWLHWLASWSFASWQPPSLSLMTMAVLILAALLIVAPWTPWRRLLPLMLLLPVMEWSFPARPIARLTMLDVGQGTAVLLETESGVLVYDTGPKAERFDAGEQVVLPALRAAGWSTIDQLWLSHADNDHAGGAAALLASLPARQVKGGEPVPDVELQPCLAGESLPMGQATVTVLHPLTADGQGKANDRSCVLRIEIAGYRILLVGDISSEVEAALVSRDPAALRADILLVPHHGSAGSSSAAFVDAVSARWALVSAGYRNPHRHPRPEVVARYQASGAHLLNTAELGAVQLDLTQPSLDAYRYARALTRLWRRSLPAN
jgi:competence protein ComEC